MDPVEQKQQSGGKLPVVSTTTPAIPGERLEKSTETAGTTTSAQAGDNSSAKDLVNSTTNGTTQTCDSGRSNALTSTSCALASSSESSNKEAIRSEEVTAGNSSGMSSTASTRKPSSETQDSDAEKRDINDNKLSDSDKESVVEAPESDSTTTAKNASAITVGVEGISSSSTSSSCGLVASENVLVTDSSERPCVVVGGVASDGDDKSGVATGASDNLIVSASSVSAGAMCDIGGAAGQVHVGGGKVVQEAVRVTCSVKDIPSNCDSVQCVVKTETEQAKCVDSDVNKGRTKDEQVVSVETGDKSGGQPEPVIRELKLDSVEVATGVTSAVSGDSDIVNSECQEQETNKGNEVEDAPPSNTLSAPPGIETSLAEVDASLSSSQQNEKTDSTVQLPPVNDNPPPVTSGRTVKDLEQTSLPINTSEADQQKTETGPSKDNIIIASESESKITSEISTVEANNEDSRPMVTTPTAPIVISISPVNHVRDGDVSSPLIGSRSSSSQHQPSNKSSAPQRPKLLANLKPKSPREMEDDELDEEETALASEGSKQTSTNTTTAVIGVCESRDVLPPRSTVVQYSSLPSIGDTGTTKCSSTIADKSPLDMRPLDGGPSSNPYINKRSSMYVNSPDFSKKSNLMSPVAASAPSGSPFKVVSTTNEYSNRYDDRPAHDVLNTPEHVEWRPPVMQLKGGNQGISGNPTLSTLKMKTPDFSKISAPVRTPPSQSEGQRSAIASDVPGEQPPHHNYKSPAIDPYSFHEMRKKYNYISDLQLKPPSDPPTTIPSSSHRNEPTPIVPRDQHLSAVGSSVTYPNLYVNTPEFTMQKFSGAKRPSQSQSAENRNSPQMDPASQYSAYHGSRSAMQYKQEQPPTPQFRGNRQPEAQYSSYGPSTTTSTASTTMEFPLKHHNVGYPGEQRRTKVPQQPLYALKQEVKTEVLMPREQEIPPGHMYPYHPGTSASGLQDAGPMRVQQPPPQRYGESGPECNYQGSVIKSYSREEQPRHQVLPQHHGYNPPLNQQQPQQLSSAISLKQQQTDLLRTDIKRIHSPNQATNFMQIPPYANMGQMQPPAQQQMNSWAGGQQQQPPRSSLSVAPGSGFTQPFPKSSPSPTHQRIGASPVPALSIPHEAVQMDYYQQRSMAPSTMGPRGTHEKYASTGDLNRSSQGQPISIQPLTKHGSADLFINPYTQHRNPNVEPERSARPAQQPPIQLPLSTYPKFQPAALIAAATNLPEPSSSLRVPQMPTKPPKQSVKANEGTPSRQHVLPGGIPGPRVKRETPLDLSVKTVKTKADSTGGFYEPGYSVSSMPNPLRPTNSLKVNYVPNFSGGVAPQHDQRNKLEAVPGPSRQNVSSMAVPYNHTSSSAALVNNTLPKQSYPVVDPNYQRGIPESRRMALPGQGPVDPGHTRIPSGYQPTKTPQYGPTVPDIYHPSRNPETRHDMTPSVRQPQYSVPGPGTHPGSVEGSMYRRIPSGPSQSLQPRTQMPREIVNVGEQQIVERKRHADFAHLSAGQQPAPKTMKVNDPYLQSTAVPPGYYNNAVYANREAPPSTISQSSSPRGHVYCPPEGLVKDSRYDQVSVQYNNYQPVAKTETLPDQHSANNLGRSDVNLDHKLPPHHQVYRSQTEMRTHIVPEKYSGSTVTGRYPVDAKMCYPPAQGAVHPLHQQHRPSNPSSSYPASQAYFQKPNMTQSSAIPATSEPIHYQKPVQGSMQMASVEYRHTQGYPAQHLYPSYPPKHQIPMPQPQNQFIDNRPVPGGVKGAGADRNVISKLKNAIEEKQQQRLIQKQSGIDAMQDENKGEIAARIRTKGEMKGYIAPQQQPPLSSLEVGPYSIAPGVNPKERFEPPADMEGVSSFDLKDWGSACNDFVEQLQTGKKKPKRRRIQKTVGVKSELKMPENLCIKNEVPTESLVPRESIQAAEMVGRAANSDGSSDEDKPLVLIRQLSLEKARITESDANTRSTSSMLMMKNVKSHTGLMFKGVKEKRLLQEKRYAARIANASSSESDTEKAKPPKPVRRKRNYAKLAVVNTARQVLTKREPDISQDDSEQEDGVRLAKVAQNRAAGKQRSVGNILKRRSTNCVSSSSNSDEPVLKKVEVISAPAKGVKAVQSKDKRTVPKPDRSKSQSKISSDTSDTEALPSSPNKKLKNTEAVKSLSDADNKAGCSKESLTPTRTTKMGRPPSKDVGRSKKKVTKLKAKPEEHMTRSRKKQKLAEQKANSLVLRNDKVIRNVGKAVPRNKPGPKRKAVDSEDAKVTQRGRKTPKVEAVNVTSSDEEEEVEEEQEASDTSSSSESDCETVVSARLRPRKAKAIEPDTTAARGPGVEKKASDPLPLVKGSTPEMGFVEATSKRGGGKRARRDNKESVTRDADESVETPNPDEKVCGSKKGRKINGDPQKFAPGWEDQLYEFKRSLKVPASLITIESPKWHRVSTSLPDLEPRSNSEEDEELDASVDKSGLKRVNDSLVPKKPSSALSSIIDLVHQRVIWPIRRLAHLGAALESVDKKANPGKVADLLLPTPVLVKSTRPKGANSKDVEHVEEVVAKNVFPRRLGKKSRTRREYNVEKNNEIIREIFGGEDRPASAPPGCVLPLACEKLSQEVSEYEAIVINKMTYEQKFEEYLGLYSTPEENCKVSNKSLQLAMSIDEAIKEDVMIFQRPMVQGEDPEHGGLVKRRIGRRGYTRRKGSSGFDYIRKKKRPVPVNMNNVGPALHCEVMEVRRRAKITFLKDRSEQDISKEIKGWVLNKGVGESVLHKATRMNLLDVVAYCLIRLEMMPDQKDNAGYTPLHEASSRGHLDIARLLLQHGANPSETSPSGIRPLHDAVENGDMEIVRLLLAYGADPKLATYAGQTPLDLAEDDDEMAEFLKAHLIDLQSSAMGKSPWRFEGPWRNNTDPDAGFNVLEGAPEVDYTEQKRLSKKRRRTRRKGSGDELVKVVPNTRKSSSLNLTVKKLSNELNGVGGSREEDEVDQAARSVDNVETGSPSKVKDSDSNDEGDLFEFEECETVLPPVYFLKDEGLDEKWCMLTDLQNLLKFKSKETLLKQICPPNGKKEELVRDFKMSEFLQKATCVQLLCSGEKLNIRASKVSLIKYTQSVRNLLGVNTVVMRL